MKCENCGERDAQIHLTQIVDNSVTTVHLCEECASSKGVQTGVAVGASPLNDFVASIGLGGVAISDADAKTECSTYWPITDFVELFTQTQVEKMKKYGSWPPASY